MVSGWCKLKMLKEDMNTRLPVRSIRFIGGHLRLVHGFLVCADRGRGGRGY